VRLRKKRALALAAKSLQQQTIAREVFRVHGANFLTTKMLMSL